WLEIYNPTREPYDLGGHFLSDDPAEITKLVFTSPTVIPAGEFLVLTEAETRLALGAPEVTLFLAAPDRTVLDARVFENSSAAGRDETSDARFPDGASRWVFARNPTPGAPNDFQVETDLVLNEIMYHPFESRQAANGPFEKRPVEYLEIYNRGNRTIPLRGFALTKGVDYAFADDAE